MELSNRLKAVAAMVSAGNCVCDVGCDHGYVPIYLIQSGICRRVIAMDVVEGPLSRAREHIAGCGLENYIETRLSDGVAALAPGEADTLITAGMGGRLVIRILSEGMEKIRQMKELILQPQSDLSQVRVFLRQQGFCIVQEDMVYEDGKYYPVMKAVYRPDIQAADVSADGQVLRQQAFDKYGPCLLQERHPVLQQFLLWEQQREQTILENLQMQGAEGERRNTRIRELLAEQALSQYALKWFT